MLIIRMTSCMPMHVFGKMTPTVRTIGSCVGVDPLTGKAGGSNVVTTYTVKILSGGGTSQTLNSLLYDFSGSSFHYNADYGVGSRIVNIVGPSLVTIAKSFSPKAIAPGGTSVMTFKLANPTTETFTGVNFTDTFLPGWLYISDTGCFLQRLRSWNPITCTDQRRNIHLFCQWNNCTQQYLHHHPDSNCSCGASPTLPGIFLLIHHQIPAIPAAIPDSHLSADLYARQTPVTWASRRICKPTGYCNRRRRESNNK